MRTQFNFRAVFLLAAVAFTLFSNCSPKKEGSEHSGHEISENTTAPAEETTKPQFEVDETFQKQLSAVFTSYVDLKNAFVSSDAGKVKDEARKTAEALGNVDMKLLSGAAHSDWMTYLSPLESSLKEIQASGDIEEQRKAFSNLTDNVYKSIKAFGLGGKEAFYEYCPMAFNNEGAYWLSENDEVRNPYFGDKMLKCGEVKEKLQ